MGDIKLILKGYGMFFVGYFYLIILSYLLPPIIEVGEGIYSGLEGMLWFFAIIIYVIIALVIPSAFIYRGVQTAGQGEDKIINAMVGILLFIFSMAITIKGWHMITAFASLTGGVSDATLGAFLTGLFWVGLIVAWLEITLITPAYLVIKSLNN